MKMAFSLERFQLLTCNLDFDRFFFIFHLLVDDGGRRANENSLGFGRRRRDADLGNRDHFRFFQDDVDVFRDDSCF